MRRCGFLFSGALLGEKLAVFYCNFHLHLSADKLSCWKVLSSRLPSDIRFAVEVRNPSWYQEAARSSEPILAGVLRNMAFVGPLLIFRRYRREFTHTGDFLYIRWIGQHGSYEQHNFERIDRSERLRDWWEFIGNYLDRVTAVYGFSQ